MSKMLRKKQCSESEKLAALQRLSDGERAMDICHDFRISPATLYAWRKRYDVAPYVDNNDLKVVEQPKKEYYTQKLYLAAVLLLKGKVVVDVLDTVPRKTIVFVNDDEIYDIINAYFDGSLEVSAKDFYTTMVEVRRMVFGPRV